MNSFFLSSLFHSSTKLAACLIYALSPFFLLCLPYLSLSICRFTISFFNHPLSHFSLLLVLFPNFTSCVFYSFSFLNFYYLLSLSLFTVSFSFFHYFPSSLVSIHISHFLSTPISLSFHCFLLFLVSFLSCLYSYFSLFLSLSLSDSLIHI